MRTRKVIFTGMLILVAMGVAACGAFRAFAVTPKDCTRPGLCEVDVVANGCSPMPANDPVRIDKSGGAIEIRWTAPDGFVFTSDGITFTPPSRVIDERPGIQQGGARWMVVDRPNREEVISKYRIKLQSTSQGTICTGPDPFITNQ